MEVFEKSAFGLKYITLLGTKINVINKNELLSILEESFNSFGEKLLVNYANAHALNLAYVNIEFREILNKSSILFCDGYGVKLAAKILNLKIGERMTPPDWIDDFFNILIRNNKSVYFLGDEEVALNKFINILKEKYPELKIAGYHNGFFEKNGNENTKIINEINSASTDTIITGMGMPIQEKWAYQNSKELDVKLIISTGALFRWYSGLDKRGSKILTDNGLEWLSRLVMYPNKVWKRYVVGLPVFFFRVIREKILTDKY